MIDKKVEVIIEGASKSDPNRLSGRTRQNHIVVFNGSQDLVGKLVGVVIHEGTDLTLFGKLTSSL
ncbi:MAG TPA: TRAM domain-containing protein [Candidatus Brocadiaceae bacterium]